LTNLKPFKIYLVNRRGSVLKKEALLLLAQLQEPAFLRETMERFLPSASACFARGDITPDRQDRVRPPIAVEWRELQTQPREPAQSASTWKAPVASARS